MTINPTTSKCNNEKKRKKGKYGRISRNTHRQRSPVLRSDKFKDCSSDDTFHYRALPGSHSFPRIKLFSRCIFRCITLSFGCRHPPFPLFFPRNSRDIRCYGSHGCSPFKTWLDLSLVSSFIPFEYLYRALSLVHLETSSSFQWRLLFVRMERTKNSPRIAFFESFPMKSRNVFGRFGLSVKRDRDTFELKIDKKLRN